MSYYRVQRNYDLNPIWALMGINLIVFIGTFVLPGLVVLLGFQPASFFAKPWTIVTNMFTHAELWHLLFNMLTLFFFGRFLLDILGSKFMLLIYFCGGILGNIFFMFLSSPNSLVIGASGAIYALGGALIVLRPQLKVIMLPVPVPMPLWVATIIGFLILLLPGMGGIAWQAHLGGLVFGLIAGWLLRKRARIVIY